MERLKKDTILSEEQLKAIQFSVNRRESLVSYSTGVGKSLIAISVGIALSNSKKIDKYIINATLSSFGEIPKDFEKFTDIDPVMLETWEDFENFLKGDEIFAITRYEYIFGLLTDRVKDRSGKTKNVINRKKVENFCRMFEGLEVGMAFDEVHKLKNPSSIVRKVYSYIRPHLYGVYGLTATPFSKLEDLFGMVTFFWPNFYSGNLFHFLNTFCVREQKTVGWNGKTKKPRKVWVTIRFRNEKFPELKELLKDLMITYYPDDKNVNYKLVRSKLTSSESMKEYYKAARGVLDAKSGKTEDRKTFSARMYDLQYVVDESDEKKKLFEDQVVKLMSEGVIVYGAYYRTLEIIEEILTKLKIDYRIISGSVSSSKKRQEIKEWFIDDPSNKVLVITDAGGQSLNLQATKNILFYNIPQSPLKFYQTIGRICRKYSSFEEFDVYILIMNNLVDDYKYTYLSSHKDFISSLLNNGLMPETNLVSEFNQYLLGKVRNSNLWK